jgi:4-azaleucine resistance transporter AzlC
METRYLKTKKQVLRQAFKAAFPNTIPIFAGFTFLGMAYGIYMNAMGFSFLYPMLMSLTILAGSIEFVTVGLLLEPFDPLRAFFMALTINARHLFYGISMLEKYRVPGIKRFYLIFGMCDESFSVNYMADIPEDVDRGWFQFFVTALNHSYWVLGATLGGLLGQVIEFNTKGLEFIMTALFIVLFLNQWMKEESHHSSLIGLTISAICLILFGSDGFIIPAMVLILLILPLFRKAFVKAGVVR